MTVNSDSIPPKTRFQGIKRRIHEFGLIAQDPILMIALILFDHHFDYIYFLSYF